MKTELIFSILNSNGPLLIYNIIFKHNVKVIGRMNIVLITFHDEILRVLLIEYVHIFQDRCILFREIPTHI